jgi:hypothetical protein
MIFFFIVTLILSLTSCSQEKNTKGQTANNTSSAVQAPKIDIHSAIIAGNLDVVQQHIKAGSNLNVIEQMSGSSPLITASTFNKIDIVKALIDANVNLSIQNNDGATALHTAAFFGRIEIVQLLIDAKADKTLKNNYGLTPRESVLGDFEQVKSVYEMISMQLQPMGFELDIAAVEKARPVVAMMLQ